MTTKFWPKIEISQKGYFVKKHPHQFLVELLALCVTWQKGTLEYCELTGFVFIACRFSPHGVLLFLEAQNALFAKMMT
eukprot:8916168-Karenia_brevis.AAC.1